MFIKKSFKNILLLTLVCDYVNEKLFKSIKFFKKNAWAKYSFINNQEKIYIKVYCLTILFCSTKFNYDIILLITPVLIEKCQLKLQAT